MHSYFRRHTLRTRSTSNPPPPKEFVRRPRYEDRRENIGEERYSRRGPPPRRLPFTASRDSEYEEQEYERSRAENPVVETRQRRVEPYKQTPNILTEMQRALWLSCYPDTEMERLQPYTNEAIAKTTADDEGEEENED